MTEGVGRSVPDGLSSATPIEPLRVSPVPASIPSAFRPFTVMGLLIEPRDILKTVSKLANLPTFFRASELGASLLSFGSFNERQEATNRLMQRWRKLGLAEYSSRGWKLTKGAWETLQAQAIEARRAETHSGSVHESAVG